MQRGVSTISLDQMIRGLLLGTPYNNSRFGREAFRYARRITSRFASDLPEDFHEEVVQEALADLIETGAAALTNRTGLGLFRRAVINAIRTIRANYSPPGRRSRLTTKPSRPTVAAESVDCIPDAKQMERATVTFCDMPMIDVEAFADPHSDKPIRRFESEKDASRIIAAAPEAMRQVFQMIYFDDVPAQEVAEQFDLNRFALNRRIETFARPWRLAA